MAERKMRWRRKSKADRSDDQAGGKRQGKGKDRPLTDEERRAKAESKKQKAAQKAADDRAANQEVATGPAPGKASPDGRSDAVSTATDVEEAPATGIVAGGEGTAPEGPVEADSPASVIPTPKGAKRAIFDQPEEGLEEEPDDLDVSRETDAVLPRPPETRVLAVVNQKGGVGKTTTAVNLAAALAMGGLRVLMIDVDPQGNASTALGIEHGSGVAGTYEVLVDQEPMAELVQESPETDNLWLLPATIDLAAAELELVSAVARETRMKRALDAYLADHEIDYVLMDCPPSLGLLTLNALVAAKEILIPIQCEYYALEGVQHLQSTIDSVTAGLNSELNLSTILLTMYDARTKLSAEVADNVRHFFPAQTLQTVVPRSVRVAEAPSFGQTVLTYQPASAGAVAYLQAAEEIAGRIGAR